MSFSKTINLGNSIIGVSILAMPYCFAQSGIVLSILLIILSGLLTRLSCHLLLKSAFLSRRRCFELMVQDVLGSAGRFLVEIGLIGFLLGTCVAYFIMIGDLAPQILSELLGISDNQNLRIYTITTLSVFVALPLSLLKKVDSLTSMSVLSILLYSFLMLKLMFETADKLSTEDSSPTKTISRISYWDISGILTTFPIISMAMSCQTSIFEIFDGSMASNDLNTMKRDNSVIKKAILMCSFVYISVGILGYTAFHNQILYGNVLLAFHPSLTTTLTKVGFIISLLLSFPLCLFPCRTSVYSLTIGKFRKTVNFQSLTSSDVTLETLVSVNQNDSEYRINNDCDNFDDNNNSGTNFCQRNVGDASKNGSGKTNPLAMHSSIIDKMTGGDISSGKHGQSNGSNFGYKKLLIDEDEDVNPKFDTENQNRVMVPQIRTSQPSRLYMSDYHFRLLTVILIFITVVISLICPQIEFILGIIGSTAGTTVCFVLPAYTFIKIGEHTKTELYLAKSLLTIGLSILVFCTYSTLLNALVVEEEENIPAQAPTVTN